MNKAIFLAMVVVLTIAALWNRFASAEIVHEATTQTVAKGILCHGLHNVTVDEADVSRAIEKILQPTAQQVLSQLKWKSVILRTSP
ncbi:MAG: hypothetical protein PUP91_28470 [Rhizonema sp. PD37]|nr:hypothetical protein [Rhizonema sp. PD37]